MSHIKYMHAFVIQIINSGCVSLDTVATKLLSFSEPMYEINYIVSYFKKKNI